MGAVQWTLANLSTLIPMVTTPTGECRMLVSVRNRADPINLVSGVDRTTNHLDRRPHLLLGGSPRQARTASCKEG